MAGASAHSGPEGEEGMHLAMVAALEGLNTTTAPDTEGRGAKHPLRGAQVLKRLRCRVASLQAALQGPFDPNIQLRMALSHLGRHGDKNPRAALGQATPGSERPLPASRLRRLER